jgi:hypothetical protein
MLYQKRGAAAQVLIAAKNSTPAPGRKLFFISVDAQMPFFSGFPQPWSRCGTRGNDSQRLFNSSSRLRGSRGTLEKQGFTATAAK